MGLACRRRLVTAVVAENEEAHQDRSADQDPGVAGDVAGDV